MAIAQLVICMDETIKQLVGEIRTLLPPLPGIPFRYDIEYIRNGVTDLFLFSEALAIPTPQHLNIAVTKWASNRNQNHRKIRCQFTSKDA
jgi:hypothetical protein